MEWKQWFLTDFSKQVEKSQIETSRGEIKSIVLEEHGLWSRQESKAQTNVVFVIHWDCNAEKYISFLGSKFLKKWNIFHWDFLHRRQAFTFEEKWTWTLELLNKKCIRLFLDYQDSSVRNMPTNLIKEQNLSDWDLEAKKKSTGRRRCHLEYWKSVKITADFWLIWTAKVPTKRTKQISSRNQNSSTTKYVLIENLTLKRRFLVCSKVKYGAWMLKEVKIKTFRSFSDY